MSFPAPSDSSIDTNLDLNQLVKNPPATFFLRVSGNPLPEACIHPGDLLIVDRSLPPTSGKLVVASVEGELLVRRLQLVDGALKLQQPGTATYHSGEFEVWGVITTVIHSV
jgi:DNA polymerase V